MKRGRENPHKLTSVGKQVPVDVEVKVVTLLRSLRRVNGGADYARFSKRAGVSDTRRKALDTSSATSLN
jgi:hypothetical protein